MLSDETINDYIDERINNNYEIIMKSTEYKKKSKMYNKLYNYLYEKLSSEDKEKFEEILNIKGDIVGFEVYLSYLIGMHDQIKINKYNFK